MARQKIDKNIAYDDVRKLYYVTLVWGIQPNGKYKKTTKTTRNKKEAKQILKEHEKAMAAGTAVAPVKETLAEIVDQYLDYKSLDLEKTTMGGYRNIAKHIHGYFGKTPIQEVTVQKLQKYRVDKTREGLGQSSIKKHFELLYSVFKDACNKEIVAKNPVAMMDRIVPKKKEHVFMTTEEIAALCESVVGTKLELPVILAVYLGLRRGEVTGLRWIDLDFDAGIVYIRNTRTKVGSVIVEKEPKTAKSKRVLGMSNEVRRVLLKAQNEQLEIKAKHKRYIDSGFVFTRRDGSPFSPNYLSDIFREHLKKHGMKQIRFHDLRHAFASIANSAGVPMGEISATMGHSNIGVTATIYTHDFVKEKVVAVNAVAEAIAKEKTTKEAC